MYDKETLSELQNRLNKIKNELLMIRRELALKKEKSYQIQNEDTGEILTVSEDEIEIVKDPTILKRVKKWH